MQQYDYFTKTFPHSESYKSKLHTELVLKFLQFYDDAYDSILLCLKYPLLKYDECCKYVGQGLKVLHGRHVCYC
jgi:hypothetical protein